MAVGLVLLLAMETYRRSVRTYHKRKAKKYAYDNLQHDALWRPLDPQGRKLTRNEARAMANYKREHDERRKTYAQWYAEGSQLPDYEQVQQIDQRERQSWLTRNQHDTATPEDEHGGAAASSTQHNDDPSDPATGDDAAESVDENLNLDRRRIVSASWSAAPPYPIGEQASSSMLPQRPITASQPHSQALLA